MKAMALRAATWTLDVIAIVLFIGFVVSLLLFGGCSRPAPQPQPPRIDPPRSIPADVKRQRFVVAMKACDKLRGQEALDCVDRAVAELEAK